MRVHTRIMTRNTYEKSECGSFGKAYLRVFGDDGKTNEDKLFFYWISGYRRHFCNICHTH